jgi:hypothetical protein
MKNLQSKHIVAIVVSALIYGGIIYISRFIPLKIGTIQVLYPAAIVAPLLGIWFRTYGAIGLVIGNLLSMLLVGLNPFIFPLALLGQFMMGYIPALLFREHSLETKQATTKFVVAVVLGQVSGTALVAVNLILFQHVPVELVTRITWPWMQVSNTLVAAILSPLVYKMFSSYMNQSGLTFKKNGING